MKAKKKKKLLEITGVEYDLEGRIKIKIKASERFLSLFRTIRTNETTMDEFGERYMVKRPFGSAVAKVVFHTDLWKKGELTITMDTLKAFELVGEIQSYLDRVAESVVKLNALEKGIEIAEVEE